MKQKILRACGAQKYVTSNVYINCMFASYSFDSVQISNDINHHVILVVLHCLISAPDKKGYQE